MPHAKEATMARGDQLARQWTIIQTLMQSRRGQTPGELAGALGCHSRTVYRDLEALQAAGFPVTTARADGRTRWQIMDGARHPLPLPLSLTELMALYLSRGVLRSLGQTPFQDAIESLLQKIQAILPAAHRENLSAFDRHVGVHAGPRRDQGSLNAVIEDLHRCLATRHYARMDYFTMSRQAHTRRKVAPLRLWFFDGAVYLIAYCTERRDLRIFALDRIQGLEVTDEPYALPDGLSADRALEASFGVFRGPPEVVRVRFDAAVAGYIRERLWHPSQVLTPEADGSLVFEAQVAGIEEIRHWILRWGRHARVLGPASLRAAVAEEAEAMVRVYGEGDGPDPG